MLYGSGCGTMGSSWVEIEWNTLVLYHSPVDLVSLCLSLHGEEERGKGDDMSLGTIMSIAYLTWYIIRMYTAGSHKMGLEEPRGRETPTSMQNQVNISN